MKYLDQSWPDYLAYGISLMEGTSQEELWKGHRWLEQANEVFEQCAAQNENPSVQVESCFRRAQCAGYQRKTIQALQWMEAGQKAYRKHAAKVSLEIYAQCCLIEGIILSKTDWQSGALAAFQHAWDLSVPNAKLRGDAAHRLGRLYAEHGEKFGHTHESAMQLAYLWFERAIQKFQFLSTSDPLVKHALVFSSLRAGIVCQSRFGYESPLALHHFARAEHLLMSLPCDPETCAVYWGNRARAAWSCCYPFPALTFSLYALTASLNWFWHTHLYVE